MNATTESQSSAGNIVKWVIVFALLGSSIASFYMLENESVLIKVPATLALIVLAAFVAFKTDEGDRFAVFAKESRTEVRKVVWPTRQEATRSTGIVILVTIVVAFMLWLIDTVLFKVVGLITGLEIN